MNPFFDIIKSCKIKTPTQKGFSQTKWNKCWNSLKLEASDKDKNIYEAGIVIASLLEEIRKELGKLYKEHTPNITNKQLLITYLALSNRDRAIMADIPKNQTKNVHSVTVTNNVVGNEITLQEVADGAVDGLEKAILFCTIRENNSNELTVGNDPIEVMDFVIRELELSQIYGMYENYWHAILWNSYELIECDKKQKIFKIKQPMGQLEIGSSVSQIRKSRLGAQSASISMSPNILSFYKKDKYLTVIKVGRKKKFLCVSIDDADDEIKFINSDWKTKSMFLSDNFSSELLDTEYENGFSINEALEVFRYLIILSVIFTRKFPDDSSVYSVKKASEFCPKVNKTDLHSSIKKSTGFEYEKILKIFNFIEYKASEKQDLWCHPIVSVSDEQYAFLTSALVTPVIIRVVEHWLVKLGIELQDKGLTYEKLVIDGVNSAINQNSKILDFDKAVSRRIKLDKGEEEIDLICRIGNLILIGEAKSIVTTDSPISNYRTVETLKKASAQVKRKTEFVKNNLPSLFEKLNWKYDPDIEYVYAQCILNSGRMYVGFGIDGVPVCDEKILIKYFSESKIPLLSVIDKKSNKERHLAWVKLYNNFDELKDNLNLYLNSPPQVFENEKHFEYKQISIPYINKDSYKIIFERFIPIDLTVKDRVEIEHYFPVEKIKNYDKAIEQVDYIV